LPQLKISIGAFLHETAKLCGVLSEILLALLALVAIDILLLWYVKGTNIKDATVDVLGWLFGNGSISGNASILEIVSLCIAGFLGYLLLGVVVWAATSALKTANDEGKGSMRSSRWLLILVFLLVVGLLGTYIWKGGASNPASGPATAELKAAELPISYSAVTHIAQAWGFIAAQGLTYRVLSVPAGPDLITALRVEGASAIDLGSIATTPVAVMIGAGDHPVVLATLIQSPAQVRLIALAGSGISSDPLSLRGKRIGFVGSTVGEIYLARLLAKAGLTDSDIKGVNGRPADLKASLVRGDLDAAVLWDPFIAQAASEAKAAKASADPQIFVESGLYRLSFYLVVPQRSIKARRADLVKYLRALVEAGNAVEGDRRRAQQELEQWLGLQAGDLTYFMDTTSFRVELNPAQVASDLRSELEWLRSRQPTTRVPEDLSTYIDATLLESVDAARIAR
jgi:sulfonate transport system substrate-binding protein